MIIGNGQIANAFIDKKLNDCLIFASGVSNSNCVDDIEFQREKELLCKFLNEYEDKKFVYFSSCALSSEEYPKNRYYKHKVEMELLIQKFSKNYYIFRIPQLFGKFKKHNTIINYLYNNIVNNKQILIYDKAYRYVIEIEDLVALVMKYLEVSSSQVIVDLANPYRYSVMEIVNILEVITGKKSVYKIIKKDDSYYLNLDSLEEFIIKNNLDIQFSKFYLANKLCKQI